MEVGIEVEMTPTTFEIIEIEETTLLIAPPPTTVQKVLVIIQFPVQENIVLTISEKENKEEKRMREEKERCGWNRNGEMRSREG